MAPQQDKINLQGPGVLWARGSGAGFEMENSCSRANSGGKGLGGRCRFVLHQGCFRRVAGLDTAREGLREVLGLLNPGSEKSHLLSQRGPRGSPSHPGGRRALHEGTKEMGAAEPCQGQAGQEQGEQGTSVQHSGTGGWG